MRRQHARPVRLLPLVLVAAIGACASPAATEPTATVSPETSAPSASAPAGGSVAASATAVAPAPSVAAPVPAWAPVPAAGPSAREDHTWTVDDEGATAYLYGGRNGAAVLGDLWALNLATDTWTELAPPAAPAPRFGHEAAWVTGIGLVIFAGQAGPDFFNDLWAYDPTSSSWTELPAGGDVPVPRYGSCSALAADGRLWISHGFTSNGTRFSDTRAYDFASGAWVDVTPTGERPTERCLHACWLTDGSDLALYGGQTTAVPALGDLWNLSDDGWVRGTQALPPPRHLPAHVRLGGAGLVFGGQSLERALLGDLWLVPDGESDATEILADGGPEPRYGAALVHDPLRDRVLLFGGRDTDRAFDDIWELTGIEG